MKLLQYFSPHQIAFEVLAIVMVAFILLKWDFVKGLLSEDGVPSSKRGIAFMVSITLCICELYHTLKGEEFEYNHLIALLVTLCLLLGIATVPQIMEIWKGKQADAPDDTKKNQ